MRSAVMVVAMRRVLHAAPLASRIVAALFGGYALGALTSVAALVLPASRPQSILTGMMLGLLVYAGAVIWVFSARSAGRAWAGLAWVALPLSAAAGYVVLTSAAS